MAGVIVVADARLLVRRDVRRIDRAYRRLHCQAAREGLAAGHAVTGHAIARARDVGAGLDQPPVLDVDRCGRVHLAIRGQQLRAADCQARGHQQADRRLDPEFPHYYPPYPLGSVHVGEFVRPVQLMEEAYAFQ
ncbi:hypothetical protein G6F63_014339 [Rhizopus arrhizus]|nr:hypothetical protein G6F63_014339 [Rhizopus arrhizus]